MSAPDPSRVTRETEALYRSWGTPFLRTLRAAFEEDGARLGGHGPLGVSRVALIDRILRERGEQP